MGKIGLVIAAIAAAAIVTLAAAAMTAPVDMDATEPEKGAAPSEVRLEEAPAAEQEAPAGAITGTVERVVDGDTLHIDDVNIRLALVDTPERGDEGFKEATDFTRAACQPGTQASYEIDAMQGTDRYGRTVAVVWCGGIDGQVSLNEALLESGHARMYERFCDESSFGEEQWATRHGC